LNSILRTLFFNSFLRPGSGSGAGFNESGSETLVLSTNLTIKGCCSHSYKDEHKGGRGENPAIEGFFRLLLAHSRRLPPRRHNQTEQRANQTQDAHRPMAKKLGHFFTVLFFYKKGRVLHAIYIL